MTSKQMYFQMILIDFTVLSFWSGSAHLSLTLDKVLEPANQHLDPNSLTLLIIYQNQNYF